jgi:hypothetical protein
VETQEDVANARREAVEAGLGAWKALFNANVGPDLFSALIAQRRAEAVLEAAEAAGDEELIATARRKLAALG